MSHHPIGSVIVTLLGIVLISSLTPMAVYGLLDTWGDRHLTVRRALMTAAATVPWVVAVSILRAS